MKSFFLSFLLLLLFLPFAFSQDASKVTMPTSPAFSILNYEPTAVMRPANAKELAADVLNSFDEDGKLLLNLGLEVMPYWLWSQPKLTREAYLNPNKLQTFLQSFSLSAATVKDSATGANKLGTGFRFKLKNGKPLTEELNAIDDVLKDKNTILSVVSGTRSFVKSGDIKSKDEAIASIVENLQTISIDESVVREIAFELDALKGGFSDSPTEIVAFLEQFITKRRLSEAELISLKSDLLYKRTGFILEFAGATSYATNGNNRLEKIGMWGNASYYMSADNLFTLTARYMNQQNDTSMKNVDLGLGYLKTSPRYNFSVEGMLRWYRAEVPYLNNNNEPLFRVEKDFSYRVAMQSSFIISNDLSINLSLGKDFNTPFVSGSGFFSILGFNYSIFSKRPPTLK